MMIVAPTSARIVERVGSKVTVATGLGLAAVSLFTMTGLQVDTSYPDLVWRLVILAAGCGGGGSSATSTETTGTTTTTITTTTTTTTTSAAPTTIRIPVVGGVPQNGIVRATVHEGDRVVLVVTSDVADEIHLHGYDLQTDVAAGGTARLPFTATIPGRFEVELERRSTQIADLTVEP
jgi:hypothetical protein